MYSRPLHVHLRSVFSLALVAAVAACGNSVSEEPTGGGGGGGGSTSTTGGECPPELLVCGDECVDPLTDAKNCGECGVDCQSASCEDGQCVVAPGCPPSLTACGDTCVDTQVDSQNCGECGLVCPPDVACGGGTCSVPVCYCGAICEWVDLGADVPVSKTVPVFNTPAQLDVSCGPGEMDDASYLFTAPFSSTFEINTLGLSPRYVQVMSTSCEILLCEAQLDGDKETITLELTEGQAVLIVLDVVQLPNDQIHLTVKEQKGCLPCAEVAWNLSPEKPICETSLPLYDAFNACMCSGACAAPCQSTCDQTGGDFTSCYNCMYDTETGCGDELSACLDDD